MQIMSRVGASVSLIFAAILISGCGDPIADAKKRLDIVKSTGDKDDQCRAERDLQEAYLQAGESYEYRVQKVTADIKCMAAERPDYGVKADAIEAESLATGPATNEADESGEIGRENWAGE